MLNMGLESTPKQFTGLFFRRLPSQGSTPCLYCAPSVWAQRNNPANCFAVQSPCEIGTEWNERRYPSERMRRRRTKRKKASHSTCFSMVRHQGLEPWTPWLRGVKWGFLKKVNSAYFPLYWDLSKISPKFPATSKSKIAVKIAVKFEWLWMALWCTLL